LLEKLYKKARTEMEAKLLRLQKSWDEIGEEFSEYIETTTNYKWFYPIYECVLLIALGGVSNWGHGPKIGVGYFLDLQKAKRVVAHEAILSHYFEIYRRCYANENLKDEQVWALAEISAYALTSLTDKAKKIWPDATYTTNHNYPQIIDLQIALKPIFLEAIERKDFDYYIKQGIKLVRKYPNMGPRF
jgi:hypothetical protein